MHQCWPHSGSVFELEAVNKYLAWSGEVERVTALQVVLREAIFRLVFEGVIHGGHSLNTIPQDDSEKGDADQDDGYSHTCGSSFEIVFGGVDLLVPLYLPNHIFMKEI